MVLVTGSASVTQRQTVEDVLLQTWHDAIEAFGTEHTLILEHGCETPTDRFVSEWGARLQLPDDGGLMSAPMAADTARHYEQAVFVRDQQMVARRPDLCLGSSATPARYFPWSRRRALPASPPSASSSHDVRSGHAPDEQTARAGRPARRAGYRAGSGGAGPRGDGARLLVVRVVSMPRRTRRGLLLRR
ncbi:hypothetical protein ACFXKH_29475 [Streptomyces caelestis]|uniref:hypothetical protein n=1 Tax=Streptomyces caelestis TaxID=36816 RepID=UPI00368BEEC2